MCMELSFSLVSIPPPSNSAFPRRGSSAAVPHFQSVSLPSVCSHLISAHTLRLSLPPPEVMGRHLQGTDTCTQTLCALFSAAPPVMAS